MLETNSRTRLRLDQPNPAESSPRYLFLDGLRGLTALYVVLHHAAAELDHEKVPWAVLKWMLPFRFGHYAVAIFIVLSGFCIALPVARDPNLALRGGLLDYLKRRARRILPPYYAALALFLGLMAAIPILRTPVTHRWEVAVPALEVGPIVSHLFLLHDLKPTWTAKIDPPMWSVAIESHIYLLFPIMLLIWRRFGLGAMLLASLCLGNVDRAFGQGYYQWACPWYVFLFAMGAAAAKATVKPSPALPWTIVAGVLLACSYYLIDRQTAQIRRNDHLFGLATACALVAFAQISREGGRLRGVLQELLESPIPLFFGRFSYSLYLIHYPLLTWFHAPMLARGWSSGTRLTLLLTAGSALCVVSAYLFYLLFERPTLARRESREPVPQTRKPIETNVELQRPLPSGAA